MREILMALALLAGAVVCADEPAAAEAVPKDYVCSLTVNPIRGTPREAGRKMNEGTKTMRNEAFGPNKKVSSGTSAEAKDNTFKWSVEVRFRGKERPASADVRAHYLGYDGVDRALSELGDEEKTVALDAGGRGTTIMTSPSIPKKEIKVSSGDWGNRRTKVSKGPEKRPKRLSGCVIQVFADGQLVASWASNTQWKRAAAKPKFSVRDLPGQPKPTNRGDK